MSQPIVVEEFVNNDLIKSVHMVAYGPFTTDEDAQIFLDNAKKKWPLRKWSYVNLHYPYPFEGKIS